MCSFVYPRPDIVKVGREDEWEIISARYMLCFSHAVCRNHDLTRTIPIGIRETSTGTAEGTRIRPVRGVRFSEGGHGSRA